MQSGENNQYRTRNCERSSYAALRAGLRAYDLRSEGSLLSWEGFVLDGALGGVYQQRAVVAEQADVVAVGELEHCFGGDYGEIVEHCKNAGCHIVRVEYQQRRIAAPLVRASNDKVLAERG